MINIDVRTMARQVANLVREHREKLALEHLTAIPGVKLAKAAQILSAFELSPDVIRSRIRSKSPLLRMSCHGGRHRRKTAGVFRLHLLNGANEVIEKRVVTIGLLDKSPVHPREVFADVIADRAAAVDLRAQSPIR